MNGFMLLIVLAATGQVAAPGPAQAQERDYGWQINPQDGLLEYIVQISPEKANFMIANNKEAESEPPAEVAVRISRVVISIGREPIISTPMSEVMKLPVRTTAVLANIESVAGRGRFSDLESAPSGGVLNVAGNNAPPSLNPGGAATPLPGTTNLPTAPSLGSAANGLADKASDLISQLPNALRQGEGLLAQNGASSFLNDSRGLGAAANSGKFSNTGTPAAAPLPTAPSNTNLPNGPISTAPLGPAPSMPGYPASTPQIGTVPTQPGSTPGMSPLGMNPLGNGTNPGAYNPQGTGNGLGPINTNGGYPNSGYPNNAAGNSYNQPGYTGAPVYNDHTALGHNSAPLGNGSLNTGNFGTPPRSATTQVPGGQYATTGNGWGHTAGAYNQTPYLPAQTQTGGYTGLPNSGLNNSAYANDPLSIPGSPNYRMADNRNNVGLPTTSGGSSNFPSPATGGSTSQFSNNQLDRGQNSLNRTTTPMPNDPSYTAQYANGRSGMENVVPVMFVLSLVVNFYLGMLIRKLLTRYRSLLSSVRSQTV